MIFENRYNTSQLGGVAPGIEEAGQPVSPRRPDNAQLVIAHYQRLLSFIIPGSVHVLVDGDAVKSGDKSLAHELEAMGQAVAG